MRSALRVERAPASPGGRRALASPTSTSSDDLGHANNHPQTRYGRPAIVCSVAQSCPFIRIANIDTLAPHAAEIIARRSDRPRLRLHRNNQRDCGAPSSATGLYRPPRTAQLPRSTISSNRARSSRLDSHAPRQPHDAPRQHYMTRLSRRQLLMYRVI